MLSRFCRSVFADRIHNLVAFQARLPNHYRFFKKGTEVPSDSFQEAICLPLTEKYDIKDDMNNQATIHIDRRKIVVDLKCAGHNYATAYYDNGIDGPTRIKIE